MMIGLLSIAVGLTIALGGPPSTTGEGGQEKSQRQSPDPAAALAPTPAAPDEPGDTEVQRPTTEELLRSLQRRRPANEPVLPVGVAAEAFHREPRELLPEGFAVVNRSGRLGKDGIWWTFESHPPDGEPPARLLPNASLEVLVRTTAGASTPVGFIVSGEMTVFGNENYLLVSVARRSVDTSLPPVPPGPTTGPQPAEIGTVAPAPTSPTGHMPEPAQVSVDDVLTAMRRQQPEHAVIPAMTDGPPSDVGSQRLPPGAGAARASIPDGSPLIRRPGRVTRDDPWWTFVFDSDNPDHGEPPLRLLPNQSVELMLQALQREKRGVVFVVSGEVTLFQGENYLLPRAAMLRRDLGNLRR